RRRHTRFSRDWSSDVCSSDLTYLVVMTLVPLLGSFITEPAAMTLGALVLASSLFSRGISTRLRYASLGLLFVNVSIGGTLTPFRSEERRVGKEWGCGWVAQHA